MNHEGKLVTVIEETMARCGIPGLAVGIVKEGAIAFCKGFGVQSLDTQAPVKTDSIFCLASTSKCFVATAVMQLVEQGRVELDGPLASYLSYFRMDDGRYSEITIRQLLSHTSGMPDMDEFEYNDFLLRPETDDGAAERYVRCLSSRKLLYAPGERFSYSNIAYDVLGDLIAKVSGQTFEAYMKEHILLPAGMPDSTFLLAHVDPPRQVMPHLRSPEMIVHPHFPYHRADAPASFLFATVEDMCHWSLACLSGSSYSGQQILTADNFARMWTPVIRRSSSPLYENMGLGWNLGHFEGMKTASHGGWGLGWTCFLALFPEEEMAAVVMSNEESSGHRAILRTAMRTLVNQEPQVEAVSWMVPIAAALQVGGIRGAYACYDELKNRQSSDYYFDEEGLLSLVFQLVGADNFDLAIEVLNLNLHAFPGDLDSYSILSILYARIGDDIQAKKMHDLAQADKTH